MVNFQWNRHLPACTGFSGTGKRCSKCNGSANMAQRNHYAALVNVALMGSTGREGYFYCPISRNADGTPVVFHMADGDVDRPNGGSDYAPGNVCLVSATANAARGVLQGKGSDIDGAAHYAAAVLRASLSTNVPTLAESRVWWQNRPRLSAPVLGFTA